MPDIYEVIAQRLRDEMVCCDTYEQLIKTGFSESNYRELKRSSNYHAICHYGEWAARIVEAMGADQVEAERQAWRESAEVQEWVARVHEEDPRLGKPLERGCPPSCEIDPKIHTGHYEPR